MPDARPTATPTIALVLGGGGPVGIAWLSGLAIGLRDAGIELALADRIIGTSAGAVVGSALASGIDIATLLTPRPRDAEPARHDYAPLLEIASLLRAVDQDRDLVLQRVGELALGAGTGDPAVHIDRIGSLVGFAEWPEHDLRIAAIDIGSGTLTAWTRDGAATLVEALASSTAVPGVFPPIEIAGRHYIDGGVRSTVNADLAVGHDVIVILEPLAHVYPRTRADRELGPAREISIRPDDIAVAAFGTDLFADTALYPAYESGVRQAAAAAAELKEFWPAAPATGRSGSDHARTAGGA
ncbi:patatin-like phospholipase family protein [Nocardia rhamnosiphila]|uniref:patatin-like phospholipase family protein n=1 Tax=Nocardia rhamnosiphila TaxID=426716 RepID=UPI000691480A|nr:patatin-like phospholipase family protein [Nocardia rhamnosiphila]